MKKFLVTQRFDAPDRHVAAAYRDEATWSSFADLPFVGTPTVQAFTGGDPIDVAVAYRVSIQLPSLAKTFIDEDKMSFVERTTLHADGSGHFEIVPDHYGKLLVSRGRIEMVPFDEGCCERIVQGSVDVRLGWSGMVFESPVEEAIVKGLTEALHAQAAQVGALLP